MSLLRGHRWKLCGSDAGMFRMFRFGPTWEEALRMFDGNFVEAMLACFLCFALPQRGKRPCACLIKTFWKFRMFRVGPTWKEAMCMFDRNFVETMPACFVETASKPCLPMCDLHAMFSYVATLVHVARIATRYLPDRFYTRTMHLSLAVLA